jgi:hypothetical protein
MYVILLDQGCTQTAPYFPGPGVAERLDRLPQLWNASRGVGQEAQRHPFKGEKILVPGSFCPYGLPCHACRAIQYSSSPFDGFSSQVPLSYDYAQLIPERRHYTLRDAISQLGEHNMQVNARPLNRENIFIICDLAYGIWVGSVYCIFSFHIYSYFPIYFPSLAVLYSSYLDCPP